jgi:hypothetical protein
MREKAVFVEVGLLRGRKARPVVSTTALEIHVRSVDHSVRTAFPAFISDEELDTIAPGPVTTMAAIELCLADLWHRAKDGYVIADFDFIDHMAAGAARRRLRAVRSTWTRKALHAGRRFWDALNRDNFVPL